MYGCCYLLLRKHDLAVSSAALCSITAACLPAINQ